MNCCASIVLSDRNAIILHNMKTSTRINPIICLISLFVILQSPVAAGGSEEGAGVPLAGPGGQITRAVILESADSTINGLPLLRVMDANGPVPRLVYDLFRNSYMNDAVACYQMAQNFLLSKGIRATTEPAYLYLSQNQGGFPRYGFYLQNGDSIIDKSEVPYIDLVKNNADPEDHLGSMTQIYPHEMGHVIYRLLSADTDSMVPGGVDIHYSTMTTDYGTAFNEGFAMHFENMARQYDPEVRRREAILNDLAEKKEKVYRQAAAFERDFGWPLRFGFYRLSMLVWYQHLEDIKRYEWVKDNKMKYMNASALFRDPEKSLFFRNSGVRHTDETRPVQQALATEGVIASFFAGLMNSEAKDTYRDAGFYMQFLPDLDTSAQDWPKDIPPIRNQYMKVFETLHYHVNRSVSIQSQLLDFVEGYLALNPGEREVVTRVFMDATGLEYPLDPGPELWVTNPDHEHGVLVMDQTGALAVPYYTFNLNAATEADLMTFDWIDQEEARQVIRFIRTKGPLQDYASLRKVPGLRPETAELIANHRFDPAYFENMEDDGFSLSLNTLFYSFLKQFLLHGLYYGIAATAAGMLMLFAMKYGVSWKQALGLMLRFFLLLLLAAVAVVMAPAPALYFGAIAVLVVVVGVLVKKGKENKFRFAWTSLPMILLLIYALI